MSSVKSGIAPSSRFFQPIPVFTAAILFHAVLLIYGHYQDQNSALKYTDIDYYVFTDAAKYVARGQSPYERDTYRYTPLLAWLLISTAWNGLWFDFGKVLFAASDVLAGGLIYRMLRQTYKMQTVPALKYASIWLLNPMVAQISTRGSSEGVLAFMVMALLWACLSRQWALAGIMLGVSVHFKIYPFIYAAAIIWWLDDKQSGSPHATVSSVTVMDQVRSFINVPRLRVTIWSLFTFSVLNIWMFKIYGEPFLEHTFFYHLVRTDHRHNFSVYNMLLYLKASPASSSSLHLESLAFLPQLVLTLLVVPLKLAKNDLPSCMLVQTFVFVTFNKVCTSQYFLWYMVFLPFYLPRSRLMQEPRLGISALVLWILGQAFWLQAGYNLEFLGKSTFVPGIYGASLLFFCTNIWTIGVIIEDIRAFPPLAGSSLKSE